jgi:hypothetical protein
MRRSAESIVLPVFKPFPFMAVKVEYRFVDRNPDEDNPEGFFSSFTVLF